MKVELEQKERKSLFGKTQGWEIVLKIIYTETEKAIIKKRNLGELGVLEYEHPVTGDIMVTFDMLPKQTWAFLFPNPNDAHEYLEYIKDRLRIAKENIDFAGLDHKKESFEL